MIQRHDLLVEQDDIDPDGHWILYDDHAAEVKLLRGQLAARDAALDAVFDLAHNDPNARCDSPGETALRHKLANIITSHGIHK